MFPKLRPPRSACFDELAPGAVVDVEHILGERAFRRT
jgi:hypothetical protein